MRCESIQACLIFFHRTTTTCLSVNVRVENETKVLFEIMFCQLSSIGKSNLIYRVKNRVADTFKMFYKLAKSKK